MKKNTFIIIVILLLLSAKNGLAQNIEKHKREANSEMRQGNELYRQGHYPEAEIAYKKAIAIFPDNPKSMYNTANSILQQKRYKEAIAQYDFLIKNTKSNRLKAESYHNIGNAYMELKNYQKAVDAYKNSLRKNPDDEETRYNLALAQELLKNQQNNQKQNKKDKDKDKDKNKDKDKDKDKKDDKKKEDNKDKKDNKDKDNKDKKDDKNKDKEKNKDKPDNKKDPSDGKQNNKENPQPQPGKLSPQQIQQLLNALNNEEKKTQDKVNAKKVKGQAVKTEKDW